MSGILGSDGNLYNALGASTRHGSELWKYNFNLRNVPALSSGAAASVNDKAMYLLNAEGLLAINVDFPGVEDSAWPMSQYDFQRTGRTKQSSALNYLAEQSGGNSSGGSVSLAFIIFCWILLFVMRRRLIHK